MQRRQGTFAHTHEAQSRCLCVGHRCQNQFASESYERFNTILSPLKLPVFLVPGNHDIRSSFRSAFSRAGYLPASGKLNWYQNVGEVHVIGLDTLIEGANAGELDGETLNFLESTLGKLENAPVILMLHHPPFKTGVKFMDSIGLCKGQDRFLELIGTYPGELIVVTGDTHLYLTHLEQVKQNLLREPFPFPKLHIKEKKKNIEAYSYSDLQIIGYKCMPNISANMAV